MGPEEPSQTPIKDRLGKFIHHPVTSLIVVILILASVTLVMAHLLLPWDHPNQEPIEVAQLIITALFVIELSTKCYVAPSRRRFFAQYWIDIIAIIPWAQSLRVLRVLRLLRVFRMAIILSRRVRFVSALFRSAIGEYIVLALIMLLLLGVGTFALYASEVHARSERARQVATRLDQLEVQLGVHADRPAAQGEGEDAVTPPPNPAELRKRLELLEVILAKRADEEEAQLILVELKTLRAKLPRRPDGETTGDLTDFENSFWATLFFLVATEPMITVPTTTVGRFVVLAVMFGGLTTFAIFTGVVTALMVNRLKRRMEIDDMDRFQLNDHMIICGWNLLVPLIIEEICDAPGETKPMVVVADLEEPPPEIANMESGARVFFVRGDYTKPEALDQARVRYAKVAIIVADTTITRSDQDRDARTVLAALMIEKMRPGIYTCAELLNRENEQHLRAAGIEEVIVTSEVGGHHLALAAMHSGISEVLSELITAKVGKHMLKRPVPEDYVGKSYVEAISKCKIEKGDLVIGLEKMGQDGPRTPGYAMLVNPAHDLTLRERDNLVMISTRKA